MKTYDHVALENEWATAERWQGIKRGYTAEEKKLGLAQVSDGHRAVRFKPCTKGRGKFTDFPGGFVVAGARCLSLNVWVRKRPIHRALSFGAGDRC